MLKGSRRSSIFIVPSGNPKKERLNSCRTAVKNVYEVGRDEIEGSEMINRKLISMTAKSLMIFYVRIIIMMTLFSYANTFS